jgi:hypothetical protein
VVLLANGKSRALSQATNAPQWAKPTDSTLVDRRSLLLPARSSGTKRLRLGDAIA